MSLESVNTESESSYSPYVEDFSSASWNGRSVSIVPCGERCNGEATLHAMIDTDENKTVEVEVEVESKDGRFSGSISGEVSQDHDGKTTGKVETEWSVKF
jgi:hypothetical protein